MLFIITSSFGIYIHYVGDTMCTWSWVDVCVGKRHIMNTYWGASQARKNIFDAQNSEISSCSELNADSRNICIVSMLFWTWHLSWLQDREGGLSMGQLIWSGPQAETNRWYTLEMCIPSSCAFQTYYILKNIYLRPLYLVS